MRVAVSWDKALEPEAHALAAKLGLPLLGPLTDQTAADALLYLTEERLELRQAGRDAPGPVYADFTGGRAEYRRKHGGGKGQHLVRAVFPKGFASPTVIDVTAGLGRDAFVLASLGARVTLLERSPIVAALLADALRRAHHSDVTDIAARMTLHVGDAVNYLEGTTETARPDVIYLDPMYPHTNKRSLQKKEMQLFRQLVGQDGDADELLEAARRVARNRVVVKRPAGAPFLGDMRPQGELESKNTRFDLYFTH